MQTQIEQLLSQLTGNASMFTAFDITMMLRRANPSTNIRHGEVRDIVHNLYQSGQFGNYVRTLCDITPGQPQAFVYHEINSDAADYDQNFLGQTGLSQFNLSALDLSQTPIQAAGRQATIQTTTLHSNAVPVVVNIKRCHYPLNRVPKDKFGRIRVPACVLRAAGFMKGANVTVGYDNGALKVGGSNLLLLPQSKSYVVDQYNNIRVNLKGKFPNASHFSMQPESRLVTILPV